jgi:threonine dehydratase
MTVTLEDIRAAHRLLDGAVERTPTLASRTLSAITGADIVLKFENLQFTGSFKDRGAYVKLCQLSEDETRAGVIAVSAGNHAQGVAYHAGRMGIPATIVMPRYAPFGKIDNTEKLGAQVVLAGENVDEAAQEAQRLAKTKGLTLIHPYDDEAIIAGQGTVALEMIEDAPDLEILVVPVGGGGLIAGMAIAAKALRPDIEVIGVETTQYPTVRRALDGQAREAGGRTIADGIAVGTTGAITLPIIRETVNDVVLVDDAAIEEAVLFLLDVEKTVAEGAGAAGLAAVLDDRERFAGRKVGVVLSGGNIDPRVLASVIHLGLVRAGRLARLHIQIPDRPGILAEISSQIAETGANIIEVHHERAFSGLPVTATDLFIVVETRSGEHVDELVGRLSAAGYATRRLGNSLGAEIGKDAAEC